MKGRGRWWRKIFVYSSESGHECYEFEAVKALTRPEGDSFLRAYSVLGIILVPILSHSFCVSM